MCNGNQAMNQAMNYQFKIPVASEQTPKVDNLWEGDDLNHQKYVPIYANMIARQLGPLTIALNSRWGTGKTFFLKRLEKVYSKDGSQAVYLNAWEDDFVEDPLTSLIFQLNRALGEDVNKSIDKSIKKAIIPLLKHGGLSIIKSLLKNNIGLNVDELSAEEFEVRSEHLAKAYSKYVDSREHLKAAFETLGSDVLKWTDKPLLIIVDELDRCRPTYAIELLERIKHLFAIPGIVFVLGIDKEQLGKSISSVYGDIDIEGYLQRFIDLEIHLPKTSKKDFISHLLEKLKLDKFLKDSKNDVSDSDNDVNIESFKNAFISLVNSQDLSLREIEQAIRKFSLIAFAKDHESHRWVLLSAVAVVVYLCNDRDFYKRFISIQIKPSQLIDALFPDFKLTYHLKAQPGAKLIIYLYQAYYYASGDNDFANVINTLAHRFSIKEDVQLSDYDLSYFPKSARKSSKEEINYFVNSILQSSGNFLDLKEIMRDIDETMHIVNEF